MTQTAIPYLFLRGGTSRGPYFRRSDLPQDQEHLAEVLMAVVGAGHPLNIDGIGGGNAVTTKVAMLSISARDDCDVDYFFAQVAVEKREVDFRPTCGNILVGVGPAAIEMGLVPAQDGETTVRIHAVNTGAVVEARVRTPAGRVSYDGDLAIAGVPGTAAPIPLGFMETVGSVTGALLPSGNLRDTIEGIEVTCMDVAMPVMMARADAFGLTGYESQAELDENREFYSRVEAIRIRAGQLMGLGDVTKSVTPKVTLLALPRNGGSITARYFMPWSCHPSMAVTGAQCIATCAILPGTVAEGLTLGLEGRGSPVTVGIEHPSGTFDVRVDFKSKDQGIEILSAGVVRTARLLARGEVMVPEAVWSGAA
ncbi:4-oxalomesaconate tautomerase [Pseudorhizobium tarimense]|uniref:4-oxalomesaconate tautomerase n=1 Tax=Pseudorhizobium tarimense TaxID=1079109 RepID=UPI001FF5BFD1|nr:4-oxalomesaconate tautomerase [Pseudorhizobium tarimense]MCJ8520892.1 4-oxalomesaconate tautomerase [Pseudorhizobium tarimense]